jgi:integrase
VAQLYRLSTAFVAKARDGKITTARRYSDGGGLAVKVGEAGRASWVFSFTDAGGHRRLMGGGPLRDVTLAQARAWAAEQRRLRLNGADPITSRDKQRRHQAEERNHGVSFAAAARAYLAAFAAGWSNAKHRHQWERSLELASAAFGSRPVGEITTPDVERFLVPIWQTTPETASRHRNRVERVLDFAGVRGWRDPNLANPARWRGHLALILPNRHRLIPRTAFSATPITELPAVWCKLDRGDSIAQWAAAFCIITASRPGMVTRATWDEIDFEAKTWTIPGARMKARRTLRVPLPVEALAILKRARAFRLASVDWIFPGHRPSAPLSLNSLSRALRAAGGSGTVHGTARATFSTWASERTHHAPAVVEQALAHRIPDPAERAYRRGDLLDKRAELMRDWGRFLRG